MSKREFEITVAELLPFSDSDLAEGNQEGLRATLRDRILFTEGVEYIYQELAKWCEAELNTIVDDLEYYTQGQFFKANELLAELARILGREEP